MLIAEKLRNINYKRYIVLPAIIAVVLFIWCVPTSFFGIDNLTIVQQRTMAIFIYAALMWSFEVIPSWATSVTTMVLLLLTITTKGIGILTHPGVGELVSHRDIMAAFGDPTIMLFMGGFILAAETVKVGLDVRLARGLLKPFGSNPKFVLLGFLLVIGLFSMFMSNTATAAMMIAFLTPVLKSLPADGKGRVGLALSIPIAANIGGIGTPIGTPPNTIAIGALNQMGIEVSFGEWMLRMVPFAIILLLFAWVILLWLFPFKVKKIELKIEGDKPIDRNYIIVCATFALTILLWVTESFTHLDSNIIALVPFGIFAMTGVFHKDDFKSIEWDILWMVAGGFALGTALNKTGLATTIIQALPFQQWSPFILMVIAGLVGYAISNFISNSSVANLVMPIFAAVGKVLTTSDAFQMAGGTKALLIGVAISTSMAMLFPISTPPNAIASSTGMVKTKDMALVGAIVGVVGLAITYLILFFIGMSPS